jgi:hypothetical protein
MAVILTTADRLQTIQALFFFHHQTTSATNTRKIKFDEEFTVVNLLNLHEQITFHKPRKSTGHVTHGCTQRWES